MISFPTARRGALPLSAPLLFAVGSAVLVIIGSLAPWAHAPSFGYVYGFTGNEAHVLTVNGTAAHGMIPLMGDGMVPLVLGSIAAVLVVWRLAWSRASGFVLGTVIALLLVSGVIGMVNWSNPGSIPSPDPSSFFKGDVAASWGVMMMTIAAWSGLLATAYQLWKDELR